LLAGSSALLVGERRRRGGGDAERKRMGDGTKGGKRSEAMPADVVELSRVYSTPTLLLVKIHLSSWVTALR
jgi:hypothetical protein